MNETINKKFIFVIILVVFVVGVETFKYIKNKIIVSEKNDPIQNVQLEPEYSIENLDIKITVMENGNLQVKENIVYDLKNDSDKVFRNYTIEKFVPTENISYVSKYAYQPEKLGLSKIECNGIELYEEVITQNGIIINKDKKTGVKRYSIEYVLEDSVEMCNNVSEFLCNLNLGTFEKEIKDLDIIVETENGANVLDAVFLGEHEILFSIEEGILKADMEKYPAGKSLWLNVKLENEAVPKTNRIILEDRAMSFGAENNLKQ